MTEAEKIEKLEQDNEQLRQQNETLTKSNEDLTTQNADLGSKLQTVTASCDEHKAANEKLISEAAANSEKANSEKLRADTAQAELDELKKKDMSVGVQVAAALKGLNIQVLPARGEADPITGKKSNDGLKGRARFAAAISQEISKK